MSMEQAPEVEGTSSGTSALSAGLGVLKVGADNTATYGHDGLPWPQTMDANAWATEFCKLNSASDHGTMLGWFANAIMIGHDTAIWKEQAKNATPNASLSGPDAALCGRSARSDSCTSGDK
jgi:hypothetical protein